MAKKGKILFDLGHDEDPLGLLVERLGKDGFVCDSYKDLISATTLEPYTALFLAYPRKDFEDEEKEDIIEFSKKGGSVVITANLQSQKEYENFVENKGDLVKALLNTEIKYKQLFPVLPLDIPENLLGWFIYKPRDKKRIPPNAPYVEYDGKKFPSIYVDYQKLKIEVAPTQEHPLLKGVEKIIKPKPSLALSYFQPVEKANVLLTQTVSPDSYYISREELKDMGFFIDNFKLNDYDTFNDILKRTLKKLESVCVGMLNPMQGGVGKNLSFCSNLFSDEQIEQDKEKNANFRLITDLLKLVSEARLFVIPAEELKPEKKEPLPIPAAPSIRIKLPDILAEIKEDAKILQKMVGDRYVTYKSVKQAREDLIDKLAEAKLYREGYFKVFIKMPEDVDFNVHEHRTLEESEYDSYRALYQSALSDLLSDIKRREKEIRRVEEKIIRPEQ